MTTRSEATTAARPLDRNVMRVAANKPTLGKLEANDTLRSASMKHHGVIALDLPRDVRDIPVTVYYTYRPGYRGCMYRHNGDPGDPPEPPDIEILRVVDRAGTELEVSDDEYEYLWYEIDHAESEARARP